MKRLETYLFWRVGVPKISGTQGPRPLGRAWLTHKNTLFRRICFHTKRRPRRSVSAHGKELSNNLGVAGARHIQMWAWLTP